MVQSFMSMINDLKSEGLVLVLRCVEMMIRTMPQDAPRLLEPLLSGFIQAVITGEHYPMVLSMYLSLVARLVLYSQEMFTWAVNKVRSFQFNSE